jgi:autotransporter passenger strand-loop-strand repeat protein
LSAGTVMDLKIDLIPDSSVSSARSGSPQADPPIVSSGQILTVVSGQVLSGVTVLSGGKLDVLQGGTVSGTIDSGGEDLCPARRTAQRSAMAAWSSSPVWGPSAAGRGAAPS